jgi:hypothetical protein
MISLPFTLTPANPIHDFRADLSWVDAADAGLKHVQPVTLSLAHDGVRTSATASATAFSYRGWGTDGLVTGLADGQYLLCVTLLSGIIQQQPVKWQPPDANGHRVLTPVGEAVPFFE